jgi:hypothetical protein
MGLAVANVGRNAPARPRRASCGPDSAGSRRSDPRPASRLRAGPWRRRNGVQPGP